MNQFEPRDPGYEARVRASFARQGLMRAIGARLVAVAPGAVEVAIPFHADLTQQHGLVHGGIVAAALDTACGYAALSLLPPRAGVQAIECAVNTLAPARGAELRARGRVLRPGRAVVACAGDAVMVGEDGQVEHVATALATLLIARDRPDLED